MSQLPVTAVGNDRSTWPSRAAAPRVPYGVTMEAGRLLNQAFAVLSGDFPRLAGITAVPYFFMIVAVVVAVVTGLVAGVELNQLDEWGTMTLMVASGGLALVLFGVILFIAAQAATFVVVDELLRGEQRSHGVFSAIAAGMSSFWRILGLYIVAGTALTILTAPVLGLGIAATAFENTGLGIGAFLLGIPTMVLAIIGGLKVSTALPIVVTEDVGAIEALRRAHALTVGNMSDVFIAFLLLGVVLFGCNIVTALVGVVPFVGSFVQLAAGVAIASLQSVFGFLVYAGLTDRKR